MMVCWLPSICPSMSLTLQPSPSYSALDAGLCVLVFGWVQPVRGAAGDEWMEESKVVCLFLQLPLCCIFLQRPVGNPLPIMPFMPEGGKVHTTGCLLI